MAWKLEHVLRDLNEMEDELATVATSLLIKRNSIPLCLSPTDIINYCQPVKRNK